MLIKKSMCFPSNQACMSMSDAGHTKLDKIKYYTKRGIYQNHMVKVNPASRQPNCKYDYLSGDTGPIIFLFLC